LSAGAGLGWNVAGWEHSTFSESSVVSLADNSSTLRPAPLPRSDGPSIALFEPMPETEPGPPPEYAMATADDIWDDRTCGNCDASSARAMANADAALDDHTQPA